MLIAAYVVGSLALAAGVGLVLLSLLRLEMRQPEGRVSEGWKREQGWGKR